LPGIASATSGSQLWLKRFDGVGYQNWAFALGTSPDGSKVFVTGYGSGSTSGYDYATVAYDTTTGAKLWVRRYNGPGNFSDVATALGMSPDGSTVFVTGNSSGSTGGYDYATVAYDASTGAKLWVRRYDGPGNRDDLATALGMSPDGSTVFVTGYSFASTSGYDYATVAYDATSGARLWVKRYNGPGNGRDVATALGVSPDGSTVFVTGRSMQTRGIRIYDYATVAYDVLTGAKLWAKRYNGPAGGEGAAATALGVSPDGSTVFVTGSSHRPSKQAADYDTVAYDASTGAQLWDTRYVQGNVATAMGVTPDGSKVFVTGWSYRHSSGAFDVETVAYDASTGAELFVKRFNGAGNGDDIATALAISPDGSKVFVTGYGFGASGNGDYETVAYAATGAKLWVMTYDGPGGNGGDYATALAVSPDGSKVFVTGRSAGSTGYFDYATVAYGA
jgi:hypothetical protein